MSKQSLSVFFSYSHKDEILRDELAKHLSLLQRDGTISTWHDRKITAGSEWANEIDKNLNTADLILLLISSDFLNSDYCHQVELKRAIKRHDAGEARVIPIILRPCRWQRAWFSKLQLFPKNGEPVTEWKNIDGAFTNIVEGIENAIAEMQKAKTTSVAPVQPPVNVNPVELLSAKGINYRELEKLLKAKEWQKADQETYRLMITAVGRENGDWFREEDLKNYPCDELLAIDRLWVKHSDGLYGFSVQKQIYEECGGKLDFSYPSDETWNRFCDRTAWKSEGKWLDYPDQFFLNKSINVKGHLPYRGRLRRGRGREREEGYFFSRIKTCEV